MKKLTRVDLVKALKVKNPDNQPVFIASEFPNGEDGDHKVLQYDPQKRFYIFHGLVGGRTVHHTHFYDDRAISEYNLFTLGEENGNNDESAG